MYVILQLQHSVGDVSNSTSSTVQSLTELVVFFSESLTSKFCRNCSHFTAFITSWVSSVSVGRGGSWEERALCMFLQCSFCLYKWQYPSTGFEVLCISVCAVFHTSPPLFSFWQNNLVSVTLSRLHCFHHACASHYTPPKKRMPTSIVLYVSLTFFVSTKPYFHIISKNVFGNRTGGL